MPESRQYTIRSMADKNDTVWINKDDLLLFLRHGVDGPPDIMRAFWTIAATIDGLSPPIDRSDPLNKWTPLDES